MYKIFSIRVEAFKNKTHWDFNKMVSEAIVVFNVARGKFKDFVDAYLAAFENEDRVYQQFNRPAMTQDINTADEIRDRLFRLYRDMLKMYISSPDAERKSMAQKDENLVLLHLNYIYKGTARGSPLLIKRKHECPLMTTNGD